MRQSSHRVSKKYEQGPGENNTPTADSKVLDARRTPQADGHSTFSEEEGFRIELSGPSKFLPTLFVLQCFVITFFLFSLPTHKT